MRKNKKKKKGFTLIEMMAGLAIFAIVATVITSMILNVNKYNAENKNQFDTNSISRAFNERIKSIRPINNNRAGTAVNEKGYPKNWDETVLGNNTLYYFIMFDDINGLNEAISNSLLLNDQPNNTSNAPNSKYTLIESNTNNKSIEELLRDANNFAIKYKYGIKVAVQNKATEKVYIFDTETIDIKNGITTLVERKFAISSIS